VDKISPRLSASWHAYCVLPPSHGVWHCSKKHYFMMFANHYSNIDCCVPWLIASPPHHRKLLCAYDYINMNEQWCKHQIFSPCWGYISGSYRRIFSNPRRHIWCWLCRPISSEFIFLRLLLKYVPSHHVNLWKRIWLIYLSHVVHNPCYLPLYPTHTAPDSSPFPTSLYSIYVFSLYQLCHLLLSLSLSIRSVSPACICFLV